MKQPKFHLLPYELNPVGSLSEAKEKAGWQITAFDLPKAWDKTKGEGVIVAILDSGCDLEHQDLKDNLIIIKGSNFVNPKKDPIDDNNHGSHVAGVIAAKNNDIGMVGVAPEAKIMPVKVLDKNGSGRIENVVKGIRFAVDNGANFICMSLGCPVKLQEVRKAIQYANNKGVICVVAAGNAGKSKEIMYPANYPETISVGSIDENFNRSNFSNTGSNLDFMAPGKNIFSTIPTNWYGVMSGTSQAAPFVCGVGALLLAYKRKSGLNISLNNSEDYKKIFRENTIPINDKELAGKRFFQGFGIIDPRKFLEKQ